MVSRDMRSLHSTKSRVSPVALEGATWFVSPSLRSVVALASERTTPSLVPAQNWNQVKSLGLMIL